MAEVVDVTSQLEQAANKLTYLLTTNEAPRLEAALVDVRDHIEAAIALTLNHAKATANPPAKKKTRLW